MYQCIVTIFNKKPGGRGDPPIWYPTVIHGANLNIDRAAIMAKYGPDSQDNAELHIRYQRDGENIMVAGKPWMPPKAWDKTEDSITFGPDDFFWKGEWTGGIVTDADYSPGGFYDHMNHTHDYVFAVSSVGGPYEVFGHLRHFEIMGK